MWNLLVDLSVGVVYNRGFVVPPVPRPPQVPEVPNLPKFPPLAGPIFNFTKINVNKTYS